MIQGQAIESNPCADLIKKYNVPVPRYTSYPTVPYWDKEKPSEKAWRTAVENTFSAFPEISLYIHLPFCENLCTYCGCNKRITKNHQVEIPYIESLIQEWQLYLDFLPQKPIIKEWHLGGGTPTFFSPDNLFNLLSRIKESAEVSEDYEFSLEVHPNTTSKAHLEALYTLGFRRLSIGIQDFAPEVLKIINRMQTYDQVVDVTNTAREIGFSSINYDLIYGLPLQTYQNIIDNIQKIESLRPERIAFYGYAHVPWVSKSQRAYSEKDLPEDAVKRSMYEMGRSLLIEAGYVEIGMDHFALSHDSLSIAAQNKTLHRNFMGYTPYHTNLLLGLGCSAISDSWTAFVQNEKKVEDYHQRIALGELPFFKGHLLSEEDQVIRKHITKLMCNHETTWALNSRDQLYLQEGLERMRTFEEDELLEISQGCVKVKPAGHPFIRNICAALDARLWGNRPSTQLFSRSI